MKKCPSILVLLACLAALAIWSAPAPAQTPYHTALNDAVDNYYYAITTGGNVNWNSDDVYAYVPYFKDSSARSGVITHNQESWMQMTVTGFGVISFFYATDCEGSDLNPFDKLEFIVDGVVVLTQSGVHDWTKYEYYLDAGTHTLRWRYSKDYSVSVGQDCARVDAVQFHPGTTLNIALNNYDLVFDSSHTPNDSYGGLWWGQNIVFHSGGEAAASGITAHNQTCSMSTTVTGPGTLSFYWAVSSEAYCDWLKVYLDDVEQPGKISGELDWAPKSVTFGPGNHTVRWSYEKDVSRSMGFDAGFVDQVRFTVGKSQPWLLLLMD